MATAKNEQSPSAVLTLGNVMLIGAVGGVVGGVLSFVLWLIAGLLGMPTEVEIPQQGLQDLAWFQFIGFATMSGAVGGLVAGLLRNRANGAQVFTIVSVVVVVVSMAGPLSPPDSVAGSTKIVLMLTHILVFITVVPAIARKLRANVT